jgi:hypothetical protein
LTAAVRTTNGVVHGVSIAPTGRNSWSVEGPPAIIAVHVSAASFGHFIRATYYNNVEAWKYHHCVAGRFMQGAVSERERAVA